MGRDETRLNPVFEYVRFGSIAFQRGYVTKEQIQQALALQVEENVSGKTHRRLGMIFREKGWITKEQEKSILDELGVGE